MHWLQFQRKLSTRDSTHKWKVSKLNLLKDINTLRPRQNGRYFPDDSFKWIFLNENVWIAIEVSLKFVPKGPINNIPALVQIMAWRRPGDKPLSEPMMVSLLTYTCVTRPQWVNMKCAFCSASKTCWHHWISGHVLIKAYEFRIKIKNNKFWRVPPKLWIGGWKIQIFFFNQTLHLLN